MTPPLLRDSGLVGAPQVLGNTISLIPMLKSVLVDGFGSYPGLGWTAPFQDANNLVLKNASNKFFKINELVTTYAPTIIGYETMSDINTGSGRIPGGDGSSTYYYLNKSSILNSTVRPWIIIGDSYGVWIITYTTETSLTPSTNYNINVNYIGDFIPFDTSDQWMSGIISCTSSSISSSNFASTVYSWTTAVTGHKLFRKYDGVTKDFTFGINNIIQNAPGNTGISSLMSGLQFWIKPILTEGISSKPFGYIPGLYYSIYDYTLFTHRQIITDSGKDFFPIIFYGANTKSLMFIDFTGDFR